jgi:phosphoserine phosphatase
MERVFILIADPRTAVIDDSMTVAVAQAVKPFTNEAVSPEVNWLAPGVACEFACSLTDLQGAIDAAHSAVADAPVDVCCLPPQQRRKQLLVADMDSTIITFETIDEVATDADPEIGAKIAQLTRRAMAGEMEYAEAFRQRTALLKSAPAALLDGVRDRITLTDGARELVATMHGEGAVCALISSGLTVFTDHVRDVLGFDHAWGNRIELDDGRITGRTIDPIRAGRAKLETLRDLRRQYDLSHEATMAVGDGANDAEMIDEAGLGVAFHAKPILAEHAAARIDHGDLTALLYLQGYRLAELRR